jgi:Domain of unknown function (DUF4276)
MHIEFLVEDSSGTKLLNILLPKILGSQAFPHTWRLHEYKGLGRIPKGLKNEKDSAKRQLLNQLPRLLSGFAKTSGIDAVVVIVDVDDKIPKNFLAELKILATSANAPKQTLFGLAIEEMEAWYFGDRSAILTVYPKAKKAVLDGYVQDSICGTWEKLADAIYQGGSKAIKLQGWPISGTIKHEWAEKIGFHMDVNNNISPSFCKLRDDLRELSALNSIQF